LVKTTQVMRSFFPVDHGQRHMNMPVIAN
jgi:hypothetical protein